MFNFQKSDVIPSLPKPKSSVSPKLGRSTPTNIDTGKTSNGSADLLGLETTKPEPKPANDDIFSSFFSAQEMPVEQKAEPKSDLKTEEENFFKQTAPTEKEKAKLTKDSILALYSQTPSNTLANQFTQQPMQSGSFGFPPYQPAPGFNNMSMQNGMSFNQFQPMPNQFQQFGSQVPQQNATTFPQFNQQSQPNLSQQFSGLSLGQNFPNVFPPNPNVASNPNVATWQ